MSSISVDAITDINGGNTTSINGTTPNAYNTVGKNLIINGAMQIAQRGTSFTNPSSNSYSVDRFKNFKNTGATFNISQVTSSPDGFSNSVRIDVTATDDPLTTNDYLYPFVQGIEGYNLTSLKYGTVNAEKLTLSFWVRSNKTGTYIAELQNPSKQTSQSYTIDSADTWEKKTVTFVGDTSTSLPTDNSGRLWLYFYVAAGPDYQSTSLQTTWSSASTGRATGQVNLLDSTSNYLELTGIQLEVGESATEFEHRPYTTELSLCQRYFEAFKKQVGSNTVGLMLMYRQSSQYWANLSYTTTKRTAPTFGLGPGIIWNSGINTITLSETHAVFYQTSNSWINENSATGTYSFSFDAEL